MKKLLLLGVACLGFVTGSAQAQVVGRVANLGNLLSPPTQPAPTPFPGLLILPALTTQLGQTLGGVLTGRLPGVLENAIPGALRIGEDVIVRVGGIIGPAPQPGEPNPGRLVNAIPGVLRFGENVIVRVGGIIGPAPQPGEPGPEAP